MPQSNPSDNVLLTRRRLLGAGACLSVASLAPGGQLALGQDAATAPAPAEPPPFELDELTLADLHNKMSTGELTSGLVVKRYIDRIEQIDRHGPQLRAVIELNPDAFEQAAALDAERASGKVRGRLHGMPVLIKDNIATGDKMATSAGSLALQAARAANDAFCIKRLREQGAVIIGKTNLSEWANGRGSNSVSGWSARGGLTRNPYALDRNTSGSSSGSAVAVAANLCAVAVGTETDGSVVSPSSVNGIVGIKPTVGRISRTGIVPLAHSQDTAGAMARTVRDAAILLDALSEYDPTDPATKEYTAHMTGMSRKDWVPDALKGARIGVVRKLFGFHRGVDAVMEEALRAMKGAGAELIDPVEIETLGKFADAEMTVITYELKADLNKYLAGLGPDAPVHSLKELIEFNERNREREMPFFGQEWFIKAEATTGLDNKEYTDALEMCRRMSRADGIDATMAKHKLDALVAPTEAPAWLIDVIDGDHALGGSSTIAAVAGYPSITVPAGFVCGLPVGISFFGRTWSETILTRLAFSFEQLTRVRKPPKFRANADISLS